MKKIQVVDYIDRNEVLELLRREAQFLSEPPMERNEYEQLKLVHELEFKIKELSTEDVEEVVRCSECKRLTVHNSPTLYAYCEKTHFRFEPFQTDTRTHFCGFGERRTDDDL